LVPMRFAFLGFVGTGVGLVQTHIARRHGLLPSVVQKMTPATN
jgi:hypothetical protein